MKKLLTILLVLFMGLAIQAQNQHKDISKKVDPIKKITSYRTPLGDDLSLHKDVYNETERVVYYLSATAYSTILSDLASGFYILFTDDSVLERKNEKVSVDYSTYKNSFSYRVFFRLSDDEIRLLATKEIKLFRIYIFDTKMSKKQSNKIKEYSDYLLNVN